MSDEAGWRRLGPEEVIQQEDWIAVADFGIPVCDYPDRMWVKRISQADIIRSTPAKHPGYVFRRNLRGESNERLDY